MWVYVLYVAMAVLGCSLGWTSAGDMFFPGW
jgi:hypothetical protein